MTSSTMRFLQQESLRLNKELEALKQQNSRLEHYLDTVKALYWRGLAITSADEPVETLSQLLLDVISVIGADDGSISRLDEEAGELVFVMVHGELRQRLAGYRMKSDVGTAGWVVENQEPLIVNYPRQDWRFSGVVDEEFGFLTRSIMSIPILGEDRLIGVIQLLNKHGEFNESDVAVVLTLSQVASKVLGNL
ncbi:MAG: GAF domain-containing protein [Anaerolineae bacterium]|nr:GAF domain-containing protein [Anaerolineae bacterium]